VVTARNVPRRVQRIEVTAKQARKRQNVIDEEQKIKQFESERVKPEQGQNQITMPLTNSQHPLIKSKRMNEK
jgi:hypothetical protein